MKKLLLLALLFIPQLSIAQTDTIIKFTKVADGLNFPEGPAWDGKGNLYVSSCYGGYITKIFSQNVSKFIDSTSNPYMKQTNGLTVHNDGNIYACDYGIGAIIKISPQGISQILIDSYEERRFNRPNDLAFDKKGNLYFTDPKSYGKDKLDGRIFKVNLESKKITLLADSLSFPNGIAFSKGGDKIFVCESAQNRILTFDVDSSGSFSNKTVFAELPGGDPDGLAFDINENLYIAHFGGGAVYILSPKAKVIEKIITPGKRPSNVEFGGDDMKTLFITECETNCVYSIQVKTPGMKLLTSPN
ncbi:MAG: SMP-30/gluconolactonase/LRE family protein [Ignavibacteriaceae bacterium]|nr:SMP-30/gluconolactonase/LRE family protein [Ignavibacteriaceae bacterium]